MFAQVCCVSLLKQPTMHSQHGTLSLSLTHSTQYVTFTTAKDKLPNPIHKPNSQVAKGSGHQACEGTLDKGGLSPLSLSLSPLPPAAAPSIHPVVVDVI